MNAPTHGTRSGTSVTTSTPTRWPPAPTCSWASRASRRIAWKTCVPAFARDVRPGDVIVAGRNFGIGSSREQAAAVLVHLGVAAVIAPSYGGLFFRNAFNLGLLLLTCPDAGSLRGQPQLAIERSPLRLVLPDGRAVACEPVPDFLLAMAQAGGLLPQLRQRLAAQASSRL